MRYVKLVGSLASHTLSHSVYSSVYRVWYLVWYNVSIGLVLAAKILQSNQIAAATLVKMEVATGEESQRRSFEVAMLQWRNEIAWHRLNNCIPLERVQCVCCTRPFLSMWRVWIARLIMAATLYHFLSVICTISVQCSLLLWNLVYFRV